MTNLIKIILAALLFLCLAKMPYGYYEFVRFISMVVFGYLAFQASENRNQIEMIIYGSLALLFQPFFKIALGRELWNVVDVIVGVGLLISMLSNKKEK